MKVRKGAMIPVRYTDSAGNTARRVSVSVYDADGTLVGTDDLTHIAGGMYGSDAVAMPGSAYAFGVLTIYQADGVTPPTDAPAAAHVEYELDVTSHLDSVTAFLDSHAELPSRVTFNVVRGEDADLPVTIIRARDDFSPLDVSAATEIIGRFTKDDGSQLEKKLSDGDVAVVSGPAGQVTISLAAADSALLMVSERQSMEVEVHVGGAVRIAQIIGKLNVRESVLG